MNTSSKDRPDFNSTNLNELLFKFGNYFNSIDLQHRLDYEELMDIKEIFLESIKVAYEVGLNNHDPHTYLQVYEDSDSVELVYEPPETDVPKSVFYGFKLGNICDIGVTFYKQP